ncbi:MAG: MurR/RpiR family transcriptional regulator [Planctomycetota bacterium]
MSIEDLIAPVSDRLTPTERRIAEAVTDDPSLLAFGTVTDLAGRVGTSPPSIVRFASKLGFDGYKDLQHEVRNGLSERLIRPSLRIRRPQGSLAPTRLAIAEAVDAVFDALDEERLASLAAPIVDARNVWILSGETSRAGAHTLHSGLSMIRPHVTLVDEHTTGRDLSGAGPEDAVVVFDFERYRRNSITTARTLADLGVTIVAITDGPLSPLASFADRWCSLSIPAVGPFDSSAPAVMAAELITAQVAIRLGDDARERIDQLEALWEATGTFLTYRPRSNG